MMENAFLFHLKSTFHSGDISIFVSNFCSGKKMAR